MSELPLWPQVPLVLLPDSHKKNVFLTKSYSFFMHEDQMALLSFSLIHQHCFTLNYPRFLYQSTHNHPVPAWPNSTCPAVFLFGLPDLDSALQKGVFWLPFLFSAECQSSWCRGWAKKELQKTSRAPGMEGKCTNAPLTRLQPPSGILQRNGSLILTFWNQVPTPPRGSLNLPKNKLMYARNWEA